MSTSRRAVYTAVMGGYETVLSTPPESAVDYICFTDDPALSSDRWRIELVAPVLPGDPVRSARDIKIAGHPLLNGYDETLWVDNRVEILSDPSDLLSDWLSAADLSMPSHSYRETVVDEFVAVLEGGFDEPSRPQEQLFHYLAHDAEALQERPFWTAIIARRTTPEIARAMAMWRDQVMRYSRRDQLSVNVAMRRADVAITIQPLESGGSGQHAWRSFTEAGRRPSDAVRRALSDALLPPAVKVRDLERQRDESIALVAALREAADGLARELGVVERERRAIEDEIERLRATLESEAQHSARLLSGSEALIDELEAVRAERDTLEAERAERDTLEAERAERDTLEAVRAERDTLEAVRAERDALGARCHEILTSTSWRVTRPLRGAMRLRRRKTRAK